MKEYTGGDKIYARPLYKEPFEFKPQFKMMLFCNKLPKVPPHDGGTWRRLEVIEFLSKFTLNPKAPNEFPLDPHLSEKIQNWKSCFMSILLHYYELYREYGLKAPSAVTKYTKEFQKECDIYSDFVEEVMVETGDMKDTFSIDSLYSSFRAWYQTNGGGKHAPERNIFTNYIKGAIGEKYIRGRAICCFKMKNLGQPNANDMEQEEVEDMPASPEETECDMVDEDWEKKQSEMLKMDSEFEKLENSEDKSESMEDARILKHMTPRNDVREKLQKYANKKPETDEERQEVNRLLSMKALKKKKIIKKKKLIDREIGEDSVSTQESITSESIDEFEKLITKNGKKKLIDTEDSENGNENSEGSDIFKQLRNENNGQKVFKVDDKFQKIINERNEKSKSKSHEETRKVREIQRIRNNVKSRENSEDLSNEKMEELFNENISSPKNKKVIKKKIIKKKIIKKANTKTPLVNGPLDIGTCSEDASISLDVKPDVNCETEDCIINMNDVESVNVCDNEEDEFEEEIEEEPEEYACF